LGDAGGQLRVDEHFREHNKRHHHLPVAESPVEQVGVLAAVSLQEGDTGQVASAMGSGGAGGGGRAGMVTGLPGWERWLPALAREEET
jgi:hypothetical protein